MEYPKIHSLWKREGWYFDEEAKKDLGKKKGRSSFIVGDYALPEFDNIKCWDVEEKIDGTNIRILFKNGVVRFGGRTKDSHIPTSLLDYLQSNFTDSLMQGRFVSAGGSHPEVILFGEGFGPKIQSGGYYSQNPGFCLFDVKIGDWWLERNSVWEIAGSLGAFFPPQLGVMDKSEIVEFVKEKRLSNFARNDPKKLQLMEGVVCRPSPMMLLRNGNPIMFKLKFNDFGEGS